MPVLVKILSVFQNRMEFPVRYCEQQLDSQLVTGVQSGVEMENPGQKLRRIRERLNLRVRDVEQASLKIADKHHNDEFAILINRISEIENRDLIPSLHKLYSLCAIYRLDLNEVMEWYGISPSGLPIDGVLVDIPQTHLLSFHSASANTAEVVLPLALDSGFESSRTTYLSRVIQHWGTVPLLFLKALNLQERKFALIGTEDRFMYPLLQPGSFVMIDETLKTPSTDRDWDNEYERPIYLFETRSGFACAWCDLNGEQLIMQPHFASKCVPKTFAYPDEVAIVGQVIGIATGIGKSKHRRPSRKADTDIKP
jgi:transcriptional regulator with XRE-family HTH domain